MKAILFSLSLILMMVTACTPAFSQPPENPLEIMTAVPTETSLPTPTQTPGPTRTVTPSSTPEASFSFSVTSDMSYYSGKKYIQYPNFFAGLLEYVNHFGPGDFMISAGDVLPAEETRWTIDQVLGEGYPWFPIPGNHDFDRADITYLQEYDYNSESSNGPIIVNWGPEPCSRTTYSFDYQNTHFVALNVYCNEDAPWGIDGSITDVVYGWLADDLAMTAKEHIIVFGHEPAFPQPDSQTGDIRHLGDSLDQYPQARDRFWGLLQSHNVLAYIHGHTHGYSATKIDGVWQLDAGQAMGVRAAPSPGTFLIISVTGSSVILRAYRGEEGPGFSFLLYQEILLTP